MANITGRLTINGAHYLEVDADPSAAATVASLGSLSTVDDGTGLYLKTGAGDTAWTKIAPGGVDTTGTPANNQVAVFTDADTLEGDPDLTWSGTRLTVAGQLIQSGGTFTINEDGGPYDFRVESTNNTHMLFVDGGSDFLGVNNSGPLYTLDISGTFRHVGAFRQDGGDVVFNELSASYDFRVEGISYTHMFFVDGSANRIGINQSTPATTFHVTGGFRQDTGNVTINELGASYDFRVESLNNTHMLFVDGGSDIIVIGSSTGTAGRLFTVDGSSSFDGAAVFNVSGSSTGDVRMESVSNANMFFLDASVDRIGFNETAPEALIHATHSSTVGLIERDSSATTGSMYETLKIRRRTSAANLSNGGGCSIAFYGQDSGGDYILGLIGVERHNNYNSGRMCIGHYYLGSYNETIKTSYQGTVIKDNFSGVALNNYPLVVVNTDTAGGTNGVLRLAIDQTTSTSDRFIRCESSADETAAGTTEFYVNGQGGTGTSLTVQHWTVYQTQPGTALAAEIEPGMIIESTGARGIHRGVETAIPVVSKCSTTKSKKVFGVLSSDWDDGKDMGLFTTFDGVYNTSSSWDYDDDPCAYDDDSRYFKSRSNSGGEGKIWVTDVAGDIGNGDYITSSDVPGYGGLQDDDVLHSYTVAKCTEDIDWGSVDDTVDHDGSTVKKALVFCTYHCG